MQKEDSLETQEICTQYNALKLARSLFRWAPVGRWTSGAEVVAVRIWSGQKGTLYLHSFSAPPLGPPPSAVQVDRRRKDGRLL